MGKKRVIRAYWDCKYCDRKHIDGLVDYCPGCGSHKPEGTKCYIDETNIEEVTDDELAKAGMKRENCNGKHPDWVCEYCNSLNNWSDNTCSSCGSPKSESKKDYFNNSINVEKDEAKLKEQDSNVETEENTFKINNNTTYQYYPSYKGDVSYKEKSYKQHRSYKDYHAENNYKTFNIKGLMTAVGVVAAIILFVFLLFPYNEQTIVDGFSWTRCINIEELRTVKESDWKVPSGGRVYNQKEELYDTVQVIDHYDEVEVEKTRKVIDHYEKDYVYTDNGDGTYNEEEIETPVYINETYTEIEKIPVYVDKEIYKTKYYYEIDKWYTEDIFKTYGNDKEPYWYTDYTLAYNQKDTNRSEQYIIYYSNGDSKTSSYNEWINTELGDRVTITKCRLGIVYSQSN